MNYKQMLIDSQKSGVSALLEFVLQYHNFDNVVAGFVEGQDFSYYRSRVTENVDANYEVLFYPCNGRSEVELVKKMIDSNLNLKSNVKTLYFCDNDYGIKKKIAGIYYTDYYSVENFYTTKDFIIKILNNIFNISKYNPDYDICIKLYEEKYNIYNKQAIKINAYCYCIRNKEKIENITERTEFNKIKFRDFSNNLEFNKFEMKDFNFYKLSNVISSSVSILEEEYINNIKQIDYTKFRGKWELEFVVWFLEELRIQIKKGANGLSKNSKLTFSFENNIMTSMKRFAETPEKLINYIRENVKI